MAKAALKAVTEEVSVKESGYSVNLVEASDVFNIKGLKIDVPVFDWDHPNSHVPAVNPDYQFSAETLLPILWALTKSRKAWLHGHTGTGKSTLIEQVCARLNWPMMRVNFDSEITRMDLIGRDVLEAKDGVTQSRFVDGILPQAIAGPFVLLCDEVDFVRPDVSYVFQRALENEGIMIAEDGGRIVKPHQWSRIFATANTQGQGDDFGIYQGARAQSLAFLDRFTVWVRCDYLPEKQEEKIVKALVEGLGEDRLKEVLAYTKEHRQAFLGNKIMQPLSPRGVIAFAEAIVLFDSMGNKKALQLAANATLLHKANTSDASVIKGILDRIEKPAVNEELETEKKKPVAWITKGC